MKIKLLCFMIVIVSFFCCTFPVSPVKAIVPQVQNIIFWNNGGDTIMNVTIFHTPVTTIHYVNQVEVDIEGGITNYPIDQPSATFTTQINLGQITGNPLARVRAHCTFDGWSSWSNQQNIPEFPLWIILPLFLVTSLIVTIYRKRMN